MSNSQWVKARNTGPLTIQASLDEESATASTRSGNDIVIINSESLNRHAILTPLLPIAAVALFVTCVINGSDMSIAARIAALIASIAATLYFIPEALCLLTVTSLEKHILSQDEINEASTDTLTLAVHEQEELFGHAQSKIKDELERRTLTN